MSGPDLNVRDDELAAMRHGELVALLNRLYATCGEPALAASTARASSDNELRDRIRGVRRRALARGTGRTDAASAGTASPVAESLRSAPSVKKAAPARRAFVVLVSDDQALARRARVSCGARGVVVVWVASSAALAKVATSVTPTHVVIERTADRIEDDCVRELAARGAQVRWCRGAQETLDALAQIE